MISEASGETHSALSHVFQQKKFADSLRTLLPIQMIFVEQVLAAYYDAETSYQHALTRIESLTHRSEEAESLCRQLLGIIEYSIDELTLELTRIKEQYERLVGP